jgi:filamentous hemagglutinin family protein
LRLKLVSAAVMSCFASAALANPTGPSVAFGTVNVSGGAGTLTVTNAGGTNAIINWQGFSINAGELTQFQQFANLAVLNRVTGTDISSILGTLRSDGRLFLINPNGIVVGAGAVLDLPGFVASSLNLADGDFLAGRMNFQAVPGAGSVENYANISPHLGGSVYLVGPAVTNGGVISTSQGEVVLAAGNSVELVSTGTPGLSVVMSASGNQALNLGQIFASDGGRVGMFGGLVTQQGYVSAGNAVMDPSGSIRLVATAATTLTAGSTTTGGSVAIDTGTLAVEGAVTSGPQSIRATGGATVRNGLLAAEGGQAIDAQFLVVETAPGAPIGAPVGVLNIGGDQRITTTGANAAGEGLVVRNAGGGVATIQGGPGEQIIEVAQALTVQGGPGTAQILGTGDQSISAESILLQGGSTGSGGSALIVSSNGSQTIDAGAGGITLVGGSSPGANNLVAINQTSTNLALTQVINSAGPVLVQGGANGTGNSAAIRAAGGQQTVVAGDTTLLAGVGGINNFSVIQGRSQDVTVLGDLTILGGSSGGTPTVGGGARIGGLGGATPTDTNLRLRVDGDLTMSAGSVSGALLGNSPTSAGPTAIAVNVLGDLVMNGGTGPGTYAGIGSRPGSPATGGNITLQAFGAIALNSTAPDQASLIRTTDTVSLSAQNITQGLDSRIEAGSLAFSAQTGVQLSGMNSVGTLSGSRWFGDVAFRNTSPLLTVTGLDAAGGSLSLQQMGDLLVRGLVISGPQNISTTGHLSVVADATSAGTLSAAGGQTISARSMDVTAQDDASAFVSNSQFGNQTITIAGGGASSGLDVRTLSGGGVAMIDNGVPGGTQTIQVTDADHIFIDGRGTGGASITTVPGNQVISIIGSGANALTLGSAGALGFSQIWGGNQSVTAGLPGQSGSITIVGSDGNSRLAGMVSQPGAGSQSVSTSGALTIVGGSASVQSGNFPAGMFHNGTGQQTINAQSILLQGGATGSGNSAIIGANNGSQTVNAGAGGITLIGGASGMNNFAMINQASTNPAFTQTVTSTGPVLLESGSGNFNFTMIRAFGGHQGLELGNTTLLAGAGGIDNFSSIQARSQDMTVHGDLAITARGSAGTPTVGGGARIGGTGGASPSATSLRLNVDGDFTMTAGSLAGSGVLLGNTTTFTGNTDIDVNVGGDVALNGGSVPGTFTTIGSRSGSVAGGNIDLWAGGAIALNSTAPDMASVIRTADSVSLTAQNITQGPDSRIEAGSLMFSSQTGAQLSGMNSVGTLSGSNWFNDVVFRNAAPLLTVTGLDVAGSNLSLQQTGDLLVRGLVISGPQNISATGHLSVFADAASAGSLSAVGGQTISARSMEVTAQDNASAFVSNNQFGNQAITIAGGGASTGLDVRVLSGNGAASISNNAAGATQAISVTDADHISVVGMGPGGASIFATSGTQLLSITGGGANAMRFGAAGAQGFSQAGGSNQAIIAGLPGESGSISIVGPAGNQRLAGIVSQPGAGNSQWVSTSGSLSVVGGSAPAQLTNFPSGILHNGTGVQAINAQSIVLQGGSAGANNSAQIGANNGTQLVNAGSIVLTGGEGGAGNSAQLRATVGQQTIDAGSIDITGGGSGENNLALIFARGPLQSIDVDGDVMLTGGAGGVANFAAIVAPVQVISIHGDLTSTGGGGMPSAVNGGGTSIGGVGGASPTPANLALTVDGDVTLNGGTAAGSGPALAGGPIYGGQRTDLSMTVHGDVTLNPGAVAGAGPRIGSPSVNLAGGEIVLNVDGRLALNSAGPGTGATIRTMDDVTLRAREISQGADAVIQANTLAIETQQGALLIGNNFVDAFNGTNTWFGDVVLRNTSPVLAMTNVQNFNGGLQIEQTGDLLVNGIVDSGPQSIDVTGGLIVQNEPFAFARLSARQGQRINAGYVEVRALDGSAFVGNLTGDQIISTTGTNGAGEGLSVRSVGAGSSASIGQMDASGSTTDRQLIDVRNADRVVVAGLGGSAAITSFNGLQSLAITGSGSGNSLEVGSPGAAGGSFIGGGGTQVIVAGNAGEAGSITLQGAADGPFSFTSISTNPVPGGSQTVSTSGALRLFGGSAPTNSGAGIFFNVIDGAQTISADSISMQGGSAGTGNGVFINSAGSQYVNAGAGGIAMVGGASGTNNPAGFFQNGVDPALRQSIVVGDGGALALRGGSAGSGNGTIIAAAGGRQQIDVGAGGIIMRGGAAGVNNFAMINQASTNPAFTQTVTSAGPVLLESGSGNFNFTMIRAFGGHQGFEAGATTLLAGASGIDNFSSIQARSQDMTVHGDLTLQARGSAGTPTVGGGARIGGTGGASPSATDLRLNVDGDFTMTAGSLAGTGVLLGNTTTITANTDIAVNVGGDMSMNGGSVPGTFATIGSRSGSLTGGNIDLWAGGAIALNSTSPDQASIIRTTDAVSLTAHSITQGVDSRIEAGSLTVNTQQGASLGGANSVSQLSMLNTASGAVDFNNTSALLTVTGIDQVPHGALDLDQAGDLQITGDVTSGAQSISATGDMTVTPGTGPNVTVEAHGAQTFSVGGSFSLLGGTAWDGYAQTLASGPVQITTGGNLTVQGGSGLLAYALLYGSDSLRLTVGDELHVNGGSGLFAFARVQTDFWEKVFLSFPNSSSGGYFVDGVEGASHRGLDGFFTGFLPARSGRSLIVSYGE